MVVLALRNGGYRRAGITGNIQTKGTIMTNLEIRKLANTNRRRIRRHARRDHPNGWLLIEELRNEIQLSHGSTQAQELVEKFGRPYVGAVRPRGYRQMARKCCVYNAARLAFQRRGTYVEGFASKTGSFLFLHAWITVDDEHAVDTTLPDGPQYQYLGIAFPEHLILKVFAEHGMYCGLLYQPISCHTIEYLSTLEANASRRPGSSA
jgi:hypothetical protein